MPKTLLLADDSVVIQKLVGLSFANEDVELVTTDNGDDAIAKAREVKPDVVLADVVMPGKNGYEVCEAIRQEAELRNTPVLLLTGTFEAFDESRARDAGSNGHITKPFEAQALVTRVNELFAQAAAAPDLANAAPAGTGDEGFDFFDDGVSNLAGEPGMDLTATSPPRDAAPAPAMDQGFDFGDSADLADAPSAPDLLGDSLGLDSAGNTPAPDQTVALMPEDDLDDFMGEPSQQSPTLTHVPTEAPVDAAPSLDDLHVAGHDDGLADGDPMVPELDDAAGLTILDEAGFSTELGTSAPPAAPTPIPMDPPATNSGAATTVIMSDGETSSDGIELGDLSPRVTNLDALDDDLADLAATGSDDMGMGGPATPNPNETVLADDLFDTNPATAEVPATPAPAASGPALDDTFDFGTSNADLDTDESPAPADPLAGMSQPPIASTPFSATTQLTDTDPLAGSVRDLDGESFSQPMVNPEPLTPPEPPPTSDPAPLADPIGYDVSSSDLRDPFTESEAPSAPPVVEEPQHSQEPQRSPEPQALALSDEDDGLSVSEGLLGADESGQSGPDISPVMRDRIHETLERVAWEAFADLSETMVKTVLERVETIAWEVIPQMAEALVKEEIRRMKGDDED
jgi:CheY-like chemotaxis protein